MIGKLAGEGDEVAEVKKLFFNFKQRQLSIDIKTKVVEHVPRIIFNVLKVFNFSKFSGSQRLSDFQKCFYFWFQNSTN